MPSEAHPTRKKLLEAGKREFLAKGWKGSSLRRICTSCGVTTGAFYFFFPSKQALFEAIVDPVICALLSLTEELAQRELEDLFTGQEGDRRMMEFELAHRQEFLILLEKAEGSSREGFREQAYSSMARCFSRQFEKAIGRRPRQDVIDLLAGLRFETNLAILKGASHMEEAYFLNSIMGCYAEGGFLHLIEQMHHKL